MGAEVAFPDRPCLAVVFGGAVPLDGSGKTYFVFSSIFQWLSEECVPFAVMLGRAEPVDALPSADAAVALGSRGGL